VDLPGEVRTRAIDRLALSHDASHYVLTPSAVVTATSSDQVADLMRAAAAQGLALTFRSGGTSLSGQGVTDQVLVDTRKAFRQIEVLDDGARVRVQPGATVRQVNNRLAPFGTKLGPDPASEAACTIGGVVANNSSGMACGTEFNSYRTVDSLVLVLASGTVIDTGRREADERLRSTEPELYAGLIRLRDRIRGNPLSLQIIDKQFALKNTMGYGVNSFVDHARPVDILARLVIGSEGTLAFVAEAVFRTVFIKPCAATGLLLFGSLRAANDALPALVALTPATAELMDATSLRVAQLDPRAPHSLQSLEVRDQAALLVELQEPTPQELEHQQSLMTRVLGELAVSGDFTTDARTRADLWHLRKGLYATVAGSRPAGTTALLEDIAVPMAALGETCEQLHELFARHDYADSVIFGHAKDGNLHFLLNERFEIPSRLERYLAFTEDMVDLVLGQGGTLKAEHGTGRIMAPYVRRQYGDELYDVMCEVKALCDPKGILNPGIVLNDDPTIHVQHLKSSPVVEEEVDRCVECGYCEPVCPSKDLTLTPRQRIVLRRELAAAHDRGDVGLVRELEADYDYAGLQTCAADGMCQTACPVLIDTGALVKRLRAEQESRAQSRLWAGAARHWDGSTRLAARGLDVAAALPRSLVLGAGAAVRRMAEVPQWSADLPGGGERRLPRAAVEPVAVYLPSCTGTMFGPADGSAGVRPALLTLLDRAGVDVRIPDEIADLCCGTPWSSKGHLAGYQRMQATVLASLQSATDGGRLPVVSDAASCTEGFRQLGSDHSVVDAISFVAEHVLPHLTVTTKIKRLALHPTCSSTRLGLDETLLEVAQAIADEVVVAPDWGCCAFAGDRGLLHPELTASATKVQAAQILAADATAHASVNRTCEIGMTRATGQSFQHLLEMVEVATRP